MTATAAVQPAPKRRSASIRFGGGTIVGEHEILFADMTRPFR